MKKLFLLAALFVAAAFSSCKHDDVEPPVVPDPQPLAIAFAEGNSLQFDVDETKIIHYTITGGSANNVVKAELQTSDDTYTVETTPTSATEGTITITAKTPEAENCIVVTVSDGSQSITAEIAVSTNPIPEGLAIAFAEGKSLQFDVDETKTVHYTITGGSENTVVKAELQTPNDAYAIETTPTSATEGTITITAQMPETENRVVVTVSDGSQSITAEIAVSTNPIPEGLAIAFAEGKSLEFYVNEPKTIHYTITGGSENTVVKAEMQTPDDAYTVSTASTSATEGTITITATKPTNNRVIVTVSDDSQTVTATIDVTVVQKAFDGKTVVVETPGTLAELLAGYDKTKITELTVTGNLNDEDIATLKNLPNLAVLDMEHANLEELPDEAFKDKTSLQSVKLPKTLKTIGYAAFWGCTSLTSITIPDSVTTIGERAFQYCTSLTSITIPDSVTTIGVGAFCGCSTLTSITIPDSVTTFGWGAFYGCSSLKSVTIPNSVTSIGQIAFYNCLSLTSITIPDSVTTIGDHAFCGCRSLTSITIPDSVTTIGDGAFVNCSGLTSVTIPDGVTSIGEWTFGGCTSLTSITIPDSVTTIGDSAFAGCSSLTSITIPDSVTTIEACAFDGCKGLKSITIGNSVKSIGYLAFRDCSGLTGVYITDMAKWYAIEFEGYDANPLSYAHNLYLNGELVTDLVIPDSVTTIGDYVFYGCRSLTSITIPDSVTTIGDYVFCGCSSLTNVTIPDSVTSIGRGAFSGCSGLTAFYGKFASSDNRCLIGAYGRLIAFAPAGLTSYAIPDSVTTIGYDAFYDCRSLTSITIPDGVRVIEANAFGNCTGLRAVYCQAVVPPTIYGGSSGFILTKITLYVPTGSKEAYATASEWKECTSIIETEF